MECILPLCVYHSFVSDNILENLHIRYSMIDSKQGVPIHCTCVNSLFGRNLNGIPGKVHITSFDKCSLRIHK